MTGINEGTWSVLLVLTRQEGSCLSLGRDRHGKEKDEQGAHEVSGKGNLEWIRPIDWVEPHASQHIIISQMPDFYSSNLQCGMSSPKYIFHTLPFPVSLSLIGQTVISLPMQYYPPPEPSTMK